MNILEMAQLAKRHGATINGATTFTQCRPQRRYKYGRHSIYQPGYRTVKGRVLA